MNFLRFTRWSRIPAVIRRKIEQAPDDYRNAALTHRTIEWDGIRYSVEMRDIGYYPDQVDITLESYPYK